MSGFPVVLKKLKFYIFFQKLRFFETRGKFEIFQLKISHHIVELNVLILKMYTVLELEIVSHKLMEENWKKFCVKISCILESIWLLEETYGNCTIKLGVKHLVLIRQIATFLF